MDLFIAIPTYDAKLTSKCVESLLQSVVKLVSLGHTVTPYFHIHDPFIDRARNMCVHLFLSTKCTDMIFIDSDVGFDSKAILKIIKHDKQIIAGACPFRRDDLSFQAELYFDPVTNNCKDEETGLVKAKTVGTGFIRIQRSVFERMIDHYKMKPDLLGIYRFFETGVVFPDDERWYGEDVVFGKKWLNMGEELFMEPDINFIHTGSKDYQANFHEFLMNRRIGVYEGGIDGWTTDKELTLLKTLSSLSKDVVEIGSWKGRSTQVLLNTCKGNVYSIDHWKGSPNDQGEVLAKQEDVYKIFMDNVGHYPNLKVLKGDSVEMANKFNGNKADMVFIDAGHSYEECKADIEAWLPKCTKYICGHDYRKDFPGVIQAVNEKFDKVNLVDSLWWVNLCN
jgi:hypothetical protein